MGLQLIQLLQQPIQLLLEVILAIKKPKTYLHSLSLSDQKQQDLEAYSTLKNNLFTGINFFKEKLAYSLNSPCFP